MRNMFKWSGQGGGGGSVSELKQLQNKLVYDLGTTSIYRWPSGVARVMKLWDRTSAKCMRLLEGRCMPPLMVFKTLFSIFRQVLII